MITLFLAKSKCFELTLTWFFYNPQATTNKLSKLQYCCVDNSSQCLNVRLRAYCQTLSRSSYRDGTETCCVLQQSCYKPTVYEIMHLLRGVNITYVQPVRCIIKKHCNNIPQTHKISFSTNFKKRREVK